MQPEPLSLYIHWPFCAKKCPYCDFNSHVSKAIDHARWRAAYLKGLDYYAGLLPGQRVSSVFFGGGTPSLMEPGTVEAVLKTVQDYWPVAEDVEITLEANPTSVEADKFKAFKTAGINRVSLGLQALNDHDLKFLGRAHSAAEGLNALETAKNNFGRVSFDLIYARPGQTLEDWRAELKNALGYADGHMSLYQLTIERATPFYMDHAQGKFSMPAEGLAADFYNLTQDIMKAANLPAYEVSNHARPGQESRHNLTYWQYGDYIGLGPGAHGRLTLNGEKHATREHRAPEIWLEKVERGGHGTHPFTALSPGDRFTETLMMGLRLREGVSLQKLEKEGAAPWQSFLNENRIKTLKKDGLLNQSAGRLRLSHEGILRLNALVPYILQNPN